MYGGLASHVKRGFRTIVMLSKPQKMDFELLFVLFMVWAPAECGAPSCHASDQGEWWPVLRRLASEWLICLGGQNANET